MRAGMVFVVFGVAGRFFFPFSVFVFQSFHRSSSCGVFGVLYLLLGLEQGVFMGMALATIDFDLLIE